MGLLAELLSSGSEFLLRRFKLGIMVKAVEPSLVARSGLAPYCINSCAIVMFFSSAAMVSGLTWVSGVRMLGLAPYSSSRWASGAQSLMTQ